LCRSPPPLLQIGLKKSLLRTSPCLRGIKIVFGLDAAIASYMKHHNSAVSQYPANEQVTVALRRILFAAEQRDAAVPRTSKYPVNPGLEHLAASQPTIKDVILLIIKLVTIWPATKLSAKRDVLDRLPHQGCLERSCVEVRDIAGPWRSTYIGDDFDVVTVEEAQEVFKSDVGVPDGVETWLCGLHGRTTRRRRHRLHPQPLVPALPVI
jgi:hypothetical protein